MNGWSARVSTVALIVMMIVSTGQATVYRLTPRGDWFRRIAGSALKPGDEVILGAGEYRDARRLVMGHRGTAGQPITIRAAEGQRAVLHRPNDSQNTINIEGAQYLILRGIEITGGSTGIRLMKDRRGPCRFVTIEQMHIHHVGGPAVTANSPGNVYEGLVFRHNHIHHTSGHAEGFYLGVNNKPDGSTAGYLFDSRIEGNYIHDLKGDSVLQGDGIEIKDGSYHNVVRDNVIHDTNYPGIIVYGTDGKAPNLIERNVIWNSNDHGIQAAAEAVIRNNIVFNNRGDGVHSQPHQSAQVGDLVITHNTVIGNRRDRAAIRIATSDRQALTGPVVLANNALYVPQDGTAVRLLLGRSSNDLVALAGNLGSGRFDGLGRRPLTSEWRGTGRRSNDLTEAYRPRAGSVLIGHATDRYSVPDDFSGRVRKKASDVGAYEFRKDQNSGWTIGKQFKSLDASGQ